MLAHTYYPIRNEVCAVRVETPVSRELLRWIAANGADPQALEWGVSLTTEWQRITACRGEWIVLRKGRFSSWTHEVFIQTFREG